MCRLYFLIGFYIFVLVNSQTQDCLSRDYGYGGTVCVCNSDHCDTIPAPIKVEKPQYLIYTSNREGLRFQKNVGEFGSENTENQIVINPEIKYQTILGWGGAFTDATGINIDSLEDDLQEKVLNSYFSTDGIEYSTCRVPIGGTDFSTHGYSYADEEDPQLENFALAEEDYKYKIPFIRRALDLTDGTLQLFASAWTAPKWMKTNGEYAGYGFLKSEYYQTWAEYFLKFLDGYRDEGIPFWGITTGNEPNTVLVPGNQINIVGWHSTELGLWIGNNLGPSIRNSAHADIKIMTHDDQRLFLPGFVDQALKNSTAGTFIDGIAVHWYTDFLIPATLLSDTHDHFPDKFLLATEACFEGGAVLGSWERGESYSNDIIEDLQNWVTGWVDWNMVLDLDGGPTYINNNVDAPIIVNTTAGEFYKQPMYYNIGHFSKFIPKGSVRIDTSTRNITDVVAVAFQKSDNGTVVVILNKNEEVVPISLVVDSENTARLDVSAKSITTILYW